MSTSPRIVIVGGVAGGATAAAKARRENEQAEITVFEKGPYVSFANCGLPYYVGGEIQERSKLILQSPESLWKRYRVKVNLFHEVVSIDRTKKSLRFHDLKENRTVDYPYDKLILAPGAGAIVPPIPGVNSENVFCVKTVPDADRIKEYINSHKVQRAVVVGAGFIGLETAEAFVHQKIDVTVVELMKQVLPPFDEDMALILQHHLEHTPIKVKLGDGLKGFSTSGNTVTEVELQSGQKIPCDLVILSIGVRPEVKLAKEAGLAMGVTGGIEVNEYQQTSDPDIYAAGDAVQVRNLITGKPGRFALAGPANKQGRVAGMNAAKGNTVKFLGAIGTSIVQVLGATAAMTGLSEKQCKSEMIPYLVSIVHPLDHVGYYPGAHILHIKLIVHKESKRILGAQIVGESGVDKRIDVLATAISGKMTVDEIENLDLAYSPQYGSAHDPVVIAAFSSLDILRGEVSNISYSDTQTLQNYQLVDVRTPLEFQEGYLEGAKNIPVDELRDRYHEIDPKKQTVLYCKIGMRGYLAARILLQLGFNNVFNLTGGYVTANGIFK